jgi:hypothetical protein
MFTNLDPLACLIEDTHISVPFYLTLKRVEVEPVPVPLRFSILLTRNSISKVLNLMADSQSKTCT